MTNYTEGLIKELINLASSDPDHVQMLLSAGGVYEMRSWMKLFHWTNFLYRRTDMRRYNFDTIPCMAAGYGVHAESKKSAWSKAYNLARKNGYMGKLTFRDMMKCPKLNYNHKGYECTVCHDKRPKMI